MDENTDRILRKDDKMYDLKTGNQGFIQLAERLKFMGTGNWYAPLEIRDISLVGVPFPLLERALESTEYDFDMIKLQRKILVECQTNIWFYLREVLRLTNIGITEYYFIVNLLSKK